MAVVFRAPGPMVLILGCFFLSGIIRMGAEGVAIAAELPAPPEETVQVEPAPMPKEEPEIKSLLDAIRTRQEQLLQREKQIAARQLVLNEVEDRIRVQLNVLVQAEQKLARTLAIADNAAENDLKKLTEVYEKMKPKKAAEIFGAMEISFAAGFLSRMRPDAAAGILSEMSPTGAYSISVVMAGRNANAPTE